MSVQTAMTAIADRIRAILGISGTMGLNAMATNLGTVQTDIDGAYTAVGNQGGTVPDSKVSGGLAAAINSIPLGVTVQSKTGTFTTSDGSATVDCGFQPDAVDIFVKYENGDEPHVSVVFADSSADRYCAMYDDIDEYCNGYCTVTRTSAGFTITGFNWYTDTWEQWVDDESTYKYYAVKYT